MGALLKALDRVPDDERAADHRGGRGRLSRRARPGHGRLRPRDHQPPRALRRDHRRVDARRHPHLGPDVEPRRRAPGHQVRDPGPLLRRRSTPRPSTTAASTAPSIPRRWARRPTSASWRRRRRSTARTTRRSRSRRRARSGSWTATARRCCPTTSRPGDIWRMCQTKDAPIRDWVQLAVARARATGWPAVFWLDETRAHDAQLLPRCSAELAELDTDGLADRDPRRRRGDAVHAGPRPRRRGHDLGHRQRAARLPHRPVPDPRARARAPRCCRSSR